jgi:hypothetical protein
MSEVQIAICGDDCKESRCRQLLAVQELRRGVERRAVAERSAAIAAMAMMRDVSHR